MITLFKYRIAMMHIVHSVFSESNSQNQTINPFGLKQHDEDFNLRLLAHQQVCNKYRNEIQSIRKYLPDWKPQFNDRRSE